jgi:hypothetical protein
MKKIFHKQPYEIANFYSPELRRAQAVELMEIRTQELREQRRRALAHIKSLTSELGDRIFGSPGINATA